MKKNADMSRLEMVCISPGYYVTDISISNYEIGKLVKDKKCVEDKISKKMAKKAFAKATMTEEQIEAFRDFNGDCDEKTKIVDSDLTEIREYMLSGKLRETRIRQNDVMSVLKRIIEHGERTLSFI